MSFEVILQTKSLSVVVDRQPFRSRDIFTNFGGNKRLEDWLICTQGNKDEGFIEFRQVRRCKDVN